MPTIERESASSSAAGRTPRLETHIVAVRDLAADETRRMFRLFAERYGGGDWEAFLADLGEKDHVLLLRDPGAGRPRGYSTQKLLRATVEGRRIRALLSGDAVVDRGFGGGRRLVRGWCRYARALRAQEPGTPLYGLSFCRDFRTYLFLPEFFCEYFPRHGAPTPPFEQAILDALAHKRFPKHHRAEPACLAEIAASNMTAAGLKLFLGESRPGSLTA